MILIKNMLAFTLHNNMPITMLSTYRAFLLHFPQSPRTMKLLYGFYGWRDGLREGKWLALDQAAGKSNSNLTSGLHSLSRRPLMKLHHHLCLSKELPTKVLPMEGAALNGFSCPSWKCLSITTAFWSTGVKWTCYRSCDFEKSTSYSHFII